MNIAVRVSRHARIRGAERFGLAHPLEIEAEVQEAFRAGRVSPAKPAGVRGREYVDVLYATTEEEDHVYIISLDKVEEGFVVVTVLPVEEEA